MPFYVIERLDPSAGVLHPLWIESVYRPFKAFDGREANRVFNGKITEDRRGEYRYRRVERDEFINKGGL